MVDEGRGAQPELVVTIDGIAHEATTGELTFGRNADISIGPDSPWVHRVVGRFRLSKGGWWVDNLARNFPLTITLSDASRVELGALRTGEPPASCALTTPTFRVVFTAGGEQFEIAGYVETELHTVPNLDHPDDSVEETRLAVLLTAEERAMMQLFARPFLEDPSAGPDAVPTNKAVARALDWPDSKLNRKLDYLCVRLTRSGFQGLKGDLGDEAKLRRWRLIQYVVSHRLVTLDPTS